MKKGIIKEVDSLGRVVLPKEIRQDMGVEPGQIFEMFVGDDGESIVLRRPEKSCFFCGNKETVKTVNSAILCEQCVKKILDV